MAEEVKITKEEKVKRLKIELFEIVRRQDLLKMAYNKLEQKKQIQLKELEKIEEKDES